MIFSPSCSDENPWFAPGADLAVVADAGLNRAYSAAAWPPIMVRPTPSRSAARFIFQPFLSVLDRL